jgi:predicted RND superfamily exporter protein
MPQSVGPLQSRAGVARFFNGLSVRAIHHPARTLVIAALLVLAAVPGLWRLKLRTDGHALVSERAPEVVYDRAIRDRFGIQDQIVVQIRSRHPDGIFNPDTVRVIRDLTARFAQLAAIGPTNVMSLATELNFRYRPRSYINRRLLEPALTNKVELDQLRDDLSQIQLYTGTLVSSDGRSTVILLGVLPGVDRSRLYQEVLRIIAGQKGVSEEIGVTGAPVAEALLGVQILEDLGVPRALLGASARASADQAAWRWPVNFHECRLLVARHIGLVPLAALVMLLVVFLCFRNWIGALVPLPGVVTTMIFVFGLMGWLGVPIYLTTAVMPVLLTVISVTNDIYLFSRYFTLLRERPGVDPVALVRETFDRLARPVACTSLAAVIGFLSFAFSPLAPVRAFGLFTGIGALLSLLYSLTVVPAMLVLIRPAWLVACDRAQKSARPSVLAVWFAKLGPRMVHRRWLVVGAALMTIALTPLGVRQLIVQDSWINGFDPASPFRRVTQEVNEDFFGMHQLFVSAEAPVMLTGELPASAVSRMTVALPCNLLRSPELIAGSPIALLLGEKTQAGTNGDSFARAVYHARVRAIGQKGENFLVGMISEHAQTDFWQQLPKADRVSYAIAFRSHLDPHIIHTLGDLGSFIRERRQCAVGGVLGPIDYLSTTRFMLWPSDPKARRLPDDPAGISMLWDHYGKALGTQRLRQVVDTNYWQSLTTVFLKDGNFVDTARLMNDIRAYEREHLAPKGIKLGFAGDVAVSQSLIHGIVTTQMQSLTWSLAGIFVVTAWFGGSLRWGFYCLLPSALAILVKFAIMGWADIPLGVATSMFAAMTLGIGVNCAIHLLEGFSLARAAGASPADALSESLRLTGPPALINTLAVSLGFGVLMLSQVPANARLGLLVVLGLVNCFIVSLVLLPVLLHWWPLKDARRP